MNTQTHEDMRVALATFSERMSALAMGQADMKAQLVDMKADIRAVQTGVDNVPSIIDERLKNYVRVADFEPVKAVVNGAVRLILVSVLVALLALVIIKS